MAVDPKANAEFHAAKDKPFAPGQTIWVDGIEFRAVSTSNGQLILAPVTAKI